MVAGSTSVTGILSPLEGGVLSAMAGGKRRRLLESSWKQRGNIMTVRVMMMCDDKKILT